MNSIISLIWSVRNNYFKNSEKLLLLALAKYYNKKYGGRINPSINTLARDIGRSRRTVIYALNSLRNKQAIFVDGHYQNGRNTSNNYVINVQLLEQQSNKTIDDFTYKSVNINRYESYPQVVQKLHGGSAKVAPKSYTESLLYEYSYQNDGSNDDKKMMTKEDCVALAEELRKINVYEGQIIRWAKTYGTNKVMDKTKELNEIVAKKDGVVKNKGAYLSSMLRDSLKPTVEPVVELFNDTHMYPICIEKRKTPESFLNVLKKLPPNLSVI